MCGQLALERVLAILRVRGVDILRLEYEHRSRGSSDVLRALAEAPQERTERIVAYLERIATVTAVSMPAPDVREAADHGVAPVEGLARMPAWPPVHPETGWQDMLEADNVRPTLPEVVSVPEAAEILEVSPQRVRKLASRNGFPEPVYELRTGKLWQRAAIEAYAARRPRKPGPPHATSNAGGRSHRRTPNAHQNAGPHD